MTSKTSFFKSLREDMRHRVWVPALACVVFLLGLIFSTLTIQSLSFENANGIDSYEAARLLSQINQMYDRQNFLLTIVAITGAVICGFQGFAYLSSKCQLDFYHSLPLRREKFFLIRWVNGVLFYVVPALAFSILSSIVLTAFGFMSTGVLGSLIIGFLHNLLIFLLVYHSAILACMITGNTLVAIGVLGMFVLYPLMITQLVPSFMSVYYHTYANYSIGLAEYLNYLSPFWIIFQLYRVSTVASYLFTIVYTTALLALSIVLYRMRASESAQKAIAFPKLRSVLRVMLVIPIALYAGLFFGQLAPDFSSFWSILGLVVFLVLVHAILEVIFDFDIHSAFHHKKELIVCGVFSIAFMTVFLTDVLKLDQQIPSQHSVKAVYMDLPIDNDVDYRDLKTGNYLSVTAYREEHAVLTGDDLDQAYALLDCRIGYADPAAEEIEYDPTPAEESELYDVSSIDADYDHILNLNVRFVKNNGQNEYRNFQIVLEDSEDALAGVFNTTTFKQGHYQIFDSACDDAFTEMTVNDVTDNYLIRSTTNTNLFTQKETKEFIDVLRKDLSAFTYEQLTTEIPMAQVYFSNENMGSSLRYYIYPSYTESIAWMNDHGIDFDAWKQRTPVSMTIYRDDEEKTTVITDSEMITSIYPYLYPEYYATRTTFDMLHANVYSDTRAAITWKLDDDVTESYFSIDKSCDLYKYIAASVE